MLMTSCVSGRPVMPMHACGWSRSRSIEARSTWTRGVTPSSAQGRYVTSIARTSTLGPGVKVDPAVQRNFMAE